MTSNSLGPALAQKIKRLLRFNSGKTAETATNEELYFAFCMALREEIMVNWTASLETVQAKRVRTAYFLSMEYLPGRLTNNNICNMGAMEVVREALHWLNRDFAELMAAEPDLGLGNGGLGRLSSCLLDSLATLHYPARAYGLRYQYGIFEQELWAGAQVERPDCWLLNLNPWEQRRDTHAVNIRFRGKLIPGTNKHGDNVFLLDDGEEVRAIPFDIPIVGRGTPFSVLTLRLWSTKESPRNFQLQRFNAGLLDLAAENASLTDVLYPNDNHEMGKRIRLKQEFLLVSASLQDILRRHLRVYGDLTEFRDKVRIQINDTHPALVIAELIRSLITNYDFSWGSAKETCEAVCSYTNHTILREALVEWNEARMQELLPRQHNIIQRLNLEFCSSVRAKFPGDEAKVRATSIIENGQIRMAHLAIVGAHAVNGVAKLHSSILKHQTFAELYGLFPHKFTNVTNGVTHRRWLLESNRELAAFITKRIGERWITDFRDIAKLKNFAADPVTQEEFLAIKRRNKESLLRLLAQENPARDAEGRIIGHLRTLGAESLFDVQIKRIHEYKRQLLNALHLIMRIQEIRCGNFPSTPRFVLFGGKAAPGYERAKSIIQLIGAIGRTIDSDPVLRPHLSVVFIENYNVSKAEIIIPAADLSEQISTAGLEASGTGNMKLAMNGALTIGTNDGANIELHEAIGDPWWPFAFGASSQDNLRPFNPRGFHEKDASIRRCVDALKDGTLAKTAAETAAFSALHESLVGSETADQFRVLQDLEDYVATQKRVEALFCHPKKWAETAIHNVGGTGFFSTDESARHYAALWGISPCPPEPGILANVQAVYTPSNVR